MILLLLLAVHGALKEGREIKQVLLLSMCVVLLVTLRLCFILFLLLAVLVSLKEGREVRQVIVTLHECCLISNAKVSEVRETKARKAKE